jgi:hypothetical protein
MGRFNAKVAKRTKKREGEQQLIARLAAWYDRRKGWNHEWTLKDTNERRGR